MLPPRLVTKEGICAYLGDIAPGTYDAWRRRGIVPGPVKGTIRYDVRAHDMVLDRIAGLDNVGGKLSALEKWDQSHGVT